jgi:WD40 repeat protein
LSQINTQGWIAYIDQEQTVHVVHPDGSGDRAIYKIGHTIDSGEISLQGWSVNGRFLAFGVWRNDTRSIFVWDSRVESGLIELKGATALFGGVLWNPQEEHLFATIQTINKPGQSSRVNQLEIWNVLNTERVIVYPDAGYGFAGSPDGEQLFFDMPYMDTKTAGQAAPCPTMPTWVTYDGIYSYEVKTGSTSRVVTAKENPLHLDSVFPNGRELIVHEGVLLCTGMDGGCMQGQSYKVDLNHPDEWTSPFGSDCEWSPDGKLTACGGNKCGDELIRIFDANGKNVQTLSQFQTAFPSPYYTKHWSPNNQLLSIEEIGWLTWSYNKNVWDSESGEIEKIPGNIVYFDWSPDGKYYVACMTPENDLNCIFTIFDYETKTEVIRLGQGRGAYVDWQPQTLPDAPANVSIRPDAGKQTYIIEWDA